MLFVSVIGCLPQGATATCSLASPDGDGYWSHRDLVSTADFRLATGGLLSKAALEGFNPPDLRELHDAVPDGYLERELRLFAEREWIQ